MTPVLNLIIFSKIPNKGLLPPPGSEFLSAQNGQYLITQSGSYYITG